MTRHKAKRSWGKASTIAARTQTRLKIVHCTSSFAPLRSPTVSNPALDSSLCRAAAPRLRPLAPRLHPLQLLLAACVRFESAAAPRPDCIRFNCCSPFASASSCCSPIVSASAAACPIASASTAAPQLHASTCMQDGCVQDSSPMFSNILRRVRGSVNKLKYEGCASL